MNRRFSFRPNVALSRGALAAAAGALALAGLAGPAAGQEIPDYPPMDWVAQESLYSHADAHDEAVDMVHWFEDGVEDRNWIYVTGFVTEMDGNTVVGTRFATYKYDGAFFDEETGAPPDPEAVAYFPPLGTAISPGDTYKATAIAVSWDGDIYVIGQAPRPGGSDQDYAVIRYNKELEPLWEAPPFDDVRYYDGPVSGDDIPVDIAVDGGNEVVVVTGTSPGSGTGLDITTVAWNADFGVRPVDLWPDIGWGHAVRRYNYADGDDRAVELGSVTIVEQDEPTLNVTVLGTSWGGSTTLDDYTTHMWGDVNGTLTDDGRYDNGANDIATAIWNVGSVAFVTGYSEQPVASFGPTGPDLNIDYATVSYDFNDPFFHPLERWVAERWDYMGGQDYPRDIGLSASSGGATHVWVTGAGGNGSSAFDVATVRYIDEFQSIDPLERWTDGWAAAGSAEWQYPQGMTLVGDEPYIVGAIGASTFDQMLALKYYETHLDPPYDIDWKRTYTGGGPYSGGPQADHEGRVVLVVPLAGPQPPSVFITGVSAVSGEGRQFTTWRYSE